MYFIRKDIVHLSRTSGRAASNGQVSKQFWETDFKVLQYFLLASCSRESGVLTNWFFLPIFCGTLLRNCAQKNNDWLSEDGKLSSKWGQWNPKFSSFCIRWGCFFLAWCIFRWDKAQVLFSEDCISGQIITYQLWIIRAAVNTEKSLCAIAFSPLLDPLAKSVLRWVLAQLTVGREKIEFMAWFPSHDWD